MMTHSDSVKPDMSFKEKLFKAYETLVKLVGSIATMAFMGVLTQMLCLLLHMVYSTIVRPLFSVGVKALAAALWPGLAPYAGLILGGAVLIPLSFQFGMWAVNSGLLHGAAQTEDMQAIDQSKKQYMATTLSLLLPIASFFLLHQAFGVSFNYSVGFAGLASSIGTGFFMLSQVVPAFNIGLNQQPQRAPEAPQPEVPEDDKEAAATPDLSANPAAPEAEAAEPQAAIGNRQGPAMTPARTQRRQNENRAAVAEQLETTSTAAAQEKDKQDKQPKKGRRKGRKR